ncbi:MAG: DEAD/DEAH box helicase family protein [Eggerthellaceae bacterium]|jgi:predicted helicase|nr:DEAD/DEAH box helicase family protein [Eggerthellaceae bacterium]MCH4220548.1 DEAD/DEAH box helicase family protein [Eggerthellaceae bacterium]
MKASKVEDIWETSVADIPYPATTDPSLLTQHVKGTEGNEGLTVIFSTYQSIQVVIDAQKQGLPVFDLCICDEAHRTTGVRDMTVSKEEQSAFTKVHDANALKATKRLYMTATPRVYGTKAIKKAHEESYEVSSMDDEAVFGKEFYRLSFGRAVECGLLTDYRVLVLTVSEAMASQVYQQTMNEEAGGFDVPEAAKILGCWKGLATKGRQFNDLNLFRADMEQGEFQSGDWDVEEILPVQRAIAFSSTIKESQRFAELFQEVVDMYIKKSGIKYPLTVETQHVDGTMDSVTRKGRLHWLEEDPGNDVCRVLSNAKCLSEGIDVPDLDAVMFMKPRNSQVDIIQAVGRVMRKSPGKQYGYIILPVVVPAGMTPEEALDDDKAFAAVWQVLQALRSHDERLDARINALMFNDGKKSNDKVVTIDNFEDDKTHLEAMQEKLVLEWAFEDLQNAMEAKLVKKCGTRVYWEDWADDVAGIAARHIKRIHNIVDTSDDARAEFNRFLGGLRDSLNPSISEDQAVEMLAQHLITLPVFEALFGDESFVQSNPVSIAMESMLDVLRSYNIEKREGDDVLETLYASVRSRISVVQSAAGRQAIIKELYEGFFSKAFKGTSEKMGIVYTPNEIVDYILHATDRMLKQEFGKGLGARGVHILDPFAGTGTFMANLIASDIISDEDLPYKYANEIHSNEILLLAYYIMTINIEQAYNARMGGDYVPFDGAVLTDTFQMTEEGDTLDTEVFTANSDRVVAQNKLDIQVIVGNPPYSAKQGSVNDNNANEAYPSLDSRIAATYAAGTNATNKNALYDSYIRAFRWATDRIDDAGVICYVSNGGWVDGQAMDGMRKCLAEEFNSIYVFHLRGNQRTQGEESRREGGKVFGSGSRAPIAITMLVKNPKSQNKGKIYFHDIGDYLTREKKLSIIKKATVADDLKWNELKPDRHGDWLNQRDDSWYQFAPIEIGKMKQPFGLLQCWTNGLQTSRDNWLYNFDHCALVRNVTATCTAYNEEIRRWEQCGTGKAEDFINKDPTILKWSSSLVLRFKEGKRIDCDAIFVKALYRPFCKQYLAYIEPLIHRLSQWKYIMPVRSNAFLSNLVIQIPGIGNNGFSCLITNTIADLNSMGGSGQCLPFYWYEKQEDLGGMFANESEDYVRHDAITDEALNVFRKSYPDAFKDRKKKDGGTELSKEDIFYYIYGILHSPEYRSRFAANLKKELPRIPLAEDFAAFSNAGRKLAYWHLNYETIEPYPLEEVGNSKDPGRTEKMRFGKCTKDDKHPKGEDRSVISVAENLTLKGIPEPAYDYMVNGKSAIGWLMDRYRVTTDKKSGIVNDPNEYSDDPRYIVDLVKRIVRVSLETIEIVGTLPPLHEKPQPADWPIVWKVSE